MRYQMIIGLVFTCSISIAQNTLPNSGNVGIGTNSPRALLDVGSDISNGVLGTVFGRLAEGDWNGSGTFLGVKGFETQFIGYGGKSFSIVHSFYGDVNSSINFYRGEDRTGGFLTFNTNSDSERMRISTNGNVGIGTVNPDSKLSVNGKIRAHEIKVETANWPDYVFAKEYQLPSLAETERHIKEKGHLPGIPSSSEVKANGIDLGEMNAKLLQKIEELTLHLIAKEKALDIERTRNDKQEERLKKIELLIKK